MNGIVYVQLPKRCGWIHDPYKLVRKLNLVTGNPLPVKKPKTADDILLTDNLDYAWRFDVDTIDGYILLADIMEKGGTIAIAGNLMRGKPPLPSACPFTPEA